MQISVSKLGQIHFKNEMNIKSIFLSDLKLFKALKQKWFVITV